MPLPAEFLDCGIPFPGNSYRAIVKAVADGDTFSALVDRLRCFVRGRGKSSPRQPARCRSRWHWLQRVSPLASEVISGSDVNVSTNARRPSEEVRSRLHVLTLSRTSFASEVW